MLGVILVLSVSTSASVAGKKPKPRKVTATYDSPAIGGGDTTGLCSGANGCVQIGIGPKEKLLSLSIEDSSGLPVSATVGQDTDPSNATTEVVGRFCGVTEKPFVIEPGVPVTVWLWVLPGLNPPCAGAATSGTVTATVR